MRLFRAQFSLWKLMAFVAAAAVILGLGRLADTFLLPAMIWDGHFPLQVFVLNSSSRDIVAVAGEPLQRIEVAQYLRAHPESPEVLWENAAWVSGQPFVVYVRCNGQTSMLGRELSYYQFPVVLVRIEYADGTREFAIVKVPDRGEPRQVFVSVP